MTWQALHDGPGSNVVECAADMLRLLGHNMPPIETAA
jgi:methylmalonyl-CoA mutase